MTSTAQEREALKAEMTRVTIKAMSDTLQEIAEIVGLPEKDWGDPDALEEAVRDMASRATAPVQVSEWQDISTAPKGVAVLVHYKNALRKGRTVKAIYINRFTEEADTENENYEYCEERDTYFTLPGWYEQIDNWGDFSSVAISEGEPTHWMPLPTPPRLNKGD